MQPTTFEVLYQPLCHYLEVYGGKIDKISDSRGFFFQNFVKIMIYYFVCKVDSLRSLVIDLKTNPVCEALGLPYVPNSTLQGAFTRFHSNYFSDMFKYLLKEIDLLSVPQFADLGILQVVDGSLFPMIKSVEWAKYMKTKNALKLHMSFNLNRMIPTSFIVGSGNSSERDYLTDIIEKGITYIADRGYFSFKVIAEIAKAKAFFIIRIKENMLYEVLFINEITGGNIPTCFRDVRDELIEFDNDIYKTNLRLVQFKVWDSYFLIATNRLELSTLQIIILYAYRWQIELMFKFMKRTLKGIHLVNHSSNGINIQFYMIMIAAILQLKIKQKCQKQVDAEVDVEPNKDLKSKQLNDIEDIPNNNNCIVTSTIQPNIWINNINEKLRYFWKLSKQWTNTLKNLLTITFDSRVVELLSSA